MISIPKETVISNIIIETAATPSDYELKITGERQGRVLAEGVLQEANKLNRNGRFYDASELFPELSAPRQEELLSTGNMRAENGHPITKDLVRQQTIDPNNTVAIFTKFWTDGDFVWGMFFGTFNDKGEEFNKELLAGILPSWSLRALGTVTNTRRGAEVRGLKMITYDRVIYPSHDKAYTKGIVAESAIGYNGQTYTVQEGSKLYLPENDYGMISPITNGSVINFIKEQSPTFKMIKESFDLIYDNIELLEHAHSVRLTDKVGNSMIVPLESYVQREIQSACVSIADQLRD